VSAQHGQSFKEICERQHQLHVIRGKGYEIETKELPDKNTVYTAIAKPKAKQLLITITSSSYGFVKIIG